MRYSKNMVNLTLVVVGFFLVIQSVTLAEITDIQTGVTGTSDNDIIDTTQPVDVNSVLETISDDDVTTAATGIDGLTGDDEITSTADMTMNSSSTVDSPFVPLKLGGTTAQSSSKGIIGGGGIDLLHNLSSILSTSKSYAGIMEVIMQIDLGVTVFSTNSTADSAGIEGGKEPDTIENHSNIEVTATSNTIVNEVHVSAVEVPLDMYAFGDDRNMATSTAIGIAGDASSGKFSSTPGVTEIIENHGLLSVTSDANSITDQVMTELIGAARIDDSTIANAYSAGILGGINDNHITNYQTIESNAISSAEMTSLEIKMKGLMLKPAFDLFGLDVGTFQTLADSTAIGMAGNIGDDIVVNADGPGKIEVYSKAQAESELFTFSISPPLGGSGEQAAVALTAGNFGLPSVTSTSTSDADSSSDYGDASTVATSNASGILGNAGNDMIINAVPLTSTAESQARNLTHSIDISLSKTSFLPIPGAAVADATTKAVATSYGIDGGTGSDIIINSANMNAVATADANSLGVAATFKGSVEGLSAGVSVTDSSSTSIAVSKGISGGAEGDTITNVGVLTSTATSLDESTSKSITLAGDKVGIAAGVTLADAETSAISYSYGIDGEDAGGDETSSVVTQNDVITNEGQISSTAQSTADADAVGVSVAASLQGISVSTAITETNVTSEAYATGIRSGIGADTIDNNDLGDINTTSTATANSSSISVAISAAYEGVAMGASFADANTAATAGAVGIDSGASIDTIKNNAEITTSSTATVSSQAIAVTASVPIKGFSAGASFANTETNSLAQATGINAGEGNDTVENTSTVSTSSTATTTTNVVSIDVAVLGAAVADASSEAKAESTGLAGGAGVDTVTNRGTVVTTSTSISDDSSSTFNLIGAASGDISSTSTATAIGMSGGYEIALEATGDTLTNASGASITAISDANAYVDDLVINGGGAALAKVGTQAESNATAMKGGVLDDTIENDGMMSSIANSQVLASSSSFNLAGVQLGSVGANATGTAVGIDSGDGTNIVTNDPNGQIHTYANLNTTSLNTEVGVLSAQFVRSGVTAEAYSHGILTGQDNDTIKNLGLINATANTLGEAGGASLGLLSLSLVDAFASADIDGICASAGNDVIINEGTILAGRIDEYDDYLVKADTEAVSFNLISLLLVSPGANARISGIDGGAGNDTIFNYGTIFIGDEAATDSCTSSRSMVIGESYGYGGQIAGAELAFAGSSARISSVGIDGGSGDDLLMNSTDGHITAKARSYADVDCETYVSLGFTDTVARSSSYSEAQATGIYGGIGWDTIENHGIITADALTVSDADSYAYVSLFTNPHAISEAEASAHAVGINGGAQGNKELDNFGSINVVADAGARPYARSDSGTMNTYGEAYGLAESEAFGITSGNVSNIVKNHDTGSISVEAMAGTYDTLGNTGFIRCDEVATISAGHYEGYKWTPLSAKGFGIALYDGNDIINNDGSIIVDADAVGQVYAYTTHGSAVNRNPDSDAQSVVLGQAMGITAGSGSNEVTNKRLLTVTATSNAIPRVYSFGSLISSSAEAYGNSNAIAVGIEADGSIMNSMDGIVDVTALAKSYVNVGGLTESESAKGTALLNATATGFSTFTDTPLTELQRITNDGTATVRAISGQDNDVACVHMRTSLTSGATVADSNGIFTVDAAGIRAVDGLKEITNNGTLNVLAQEQNRLADAIAFSTYNRTTTTSYGKGTATATGILATSGENHIYNFGTMDVNAVMDVDTRSYSDSGWQSTYTTYSTSETHAETLGQGILVGSGDDEIINVGSVIVTSTAEATSNARSDEYATSTAISEATAIGIDAGDGSNTIINEKTGILDVTARAMVATYASGDYRTWNPETTTSAAGITAGNGGSYIRNSGTINVQALDYDNSSYHNIMVVGIRGGNGNDTIINEGDIDTFSGLYDVPSGPRERAQIAIDAGAGDDTVVLAGGSNINGSVYLGAGNDTFILTGTVNGNSNFLADEGTDTIVFDGTGSLLTHVLMDFENAMKRGSGTYTLPYSFQLRMTELLEVREGALEIVGFAFSPTNMFKTIISPDGNCGQLKNIGFSTLSLDGTLAVERESGLYQQTRTYDIVTSILPISGEFDDVQLPGSGPLLEFSMKQTPNLVQISVTPKEFASAASNQTERSTGQYLDSIMPQTTGRLYDILGTFQALSASELSTAYASLSPAMYDSATTTTFDITSDFTQTLVKRMHSLRSHIESINSDLTYRQTDEYATWIDGFGHNSSHDSQGGFAGYDYHMTGAAVGADQLLVDGILAGISYGQANADIDMDNNTGSNDIESYFGSLYGSFFNEDMYCDAALSYGRQDYDSIRAIEIGALRDTAYSDHYGDIYSAYAETGWNFSLNKFSLQPFASLRYTFLDEESYNESGAEGINFRFEDRQTDSLVSDLGLRMTCPFKKSTWLCIPEATVAWDHDFKIDDRRITAAFDGSPTMTFVTDGRDTDENGLVLGTGMTLINNDNVNISIKYTGELRSHSKSHALTLGMRCEF